jgi:hypothetical protein
LLAIDPAPITARTLIGTGRRSNAFRSYATRFT